MTYTITGTDKTNRFYTAIGELMNLTYEWKDQAVNTHIKAMEFPSGKERKFEIQFGFLMDQSVIRITSYNDDTKKYDTIILYIDWENVHELFEAMATLSNGAIYGKCFFGNEFYRSFEEDYGHLAVFTGSNSNVIIDIKE